MSDRIAHRPHYRSMRHITPPHGNTRQSFFYTHWTYKRQASLYQKRPLGYGLSLIPLGYYGMRKFLLPRL